jgi:hypothetical protein
MSARGPLHDNDDDGDEDKPASSGGVNSCISDSCSISDETGLSASNVWPSLNDLSLSVPS